MLLLLMPTSDGLFATAASLRGFRKYATNLATPVVSHSVRHTVMNKVPMILLEASDCLPLNAHTEVIQRLQCRSKFSLMFRLQLIEQIHLLLTNERQFAKTMRVAKVTTSKGDI